MSIDGRAVANFILDFCEKAERPVTQLSLQKISFFCHAWYLVKFEKPLIKQHFEAWKFGPVLQHLQREFKDFEDQPITRRSKQINRFNGTKETVQYSFEEKDSVFLEQIVDFYSRIGARQLVELSHVEGGPWDTTFHHDGVVNPGMAISNDQIKLYYSKVHTPISVQ